MPVLLQHSPTDEVLPYSATLRLAEDWAGADVDFRPVPGEHLSAACRQPDRLLMAGHAPGLLGMALPGAPDGRECQSAGR